MTCFDFEERLQSHLDLRECRLSEDLVAHAAVCGSCRATFDLFQRIETAVVGWPDFEMPVDLVAAVIDRVKSSPAADVTSPVSVTIDREAEEIGRAHV